MHRTRIYFLIGCLWAVPCGLAADPLAKIPAPIEVKRKPASAAPAAVPMPVPKIEQSAVDKKAVDKKAADKKEKDKK